MKIIKSAASLALLLSLLTVTHLSLFAQVQKKYVNEKFGLGFYYPGQYLLENINDEQWIIRKADNTWVVGFAAFNLGGADYSSYITEFTHQLFTSIATASGLKGTILSTTALHHIRESMALGFQLDGISHTAEGIGNGMQKLESSRTLYMKILRKTAKNHNLPDGIIVYDFANAFDKSHLALTTSLIEGLEKSLYFMANVPSKPAVTPSQRSSGTEKSPAIPLQGNVEQVKIGDQIWMSENLNVSTFKNGEAIPEAKTSLAWKKAGEAGTPAWCYYNNDPKNGSKYGKLYNYYAVTDKRGLAPQGWHVANYLEYESLAEDLDGKYNAAVKMKTTSGWDKKGNGTNASGLSVLPGASRDQDGDFFGIGCWAYFWCPYTTTPRSLRMFCDGNSVSIHSEITDCCKKGVGMSVRCIKD